MAAERGALYQRQAQTLIASWRYFANWSSGAAIHEEPGVQVAVFPAAPERFVYNNALLELGLDRAESARAMDRVESLYAVARVRTYAVWVHEAEDRAGDEVRDRGYRLATSTRAMGMELDELTVDRPSLDLGDADWEEHPRLIEGPEGLLEGIDPHPLNVVVARLCGVNAASAIAYDFDGDCGLYNLGTVPESRRQGIGTDVAALQLWNARDRGCTTASIQSTEIAEGVYFSVGFRDLGRYLEYVRATE